MHKIIPVLLSVPNVAEEDEIRLLALLLFTREINKDANRNMEPYKLSLPLSLCVSVRLFFTLLFHKLFSFVPDSHYLFKPCLSLSYYCSIIVLRC